MIPVNRSTMPSVLMAGRTGGVEAQAGNIEAVKHIFNEHAEGESIRNGLWYKCFPHPAPDGGPSSDGKNYITFESTWTFKATPPKKSGVDYWVKQKLFRTVILYCPKDKETHRVESIVNEVLRLVGTETSPNMPDVHREPRGFALLCDGDKTWCQMSCFELGILTLKETTDTAYNQDYANTAETESYTSEDGGATWGGREGHEDGPGQSGSWTPPRDMKDVSDYLGYYIADYFIEHCPQGTGTAMVQVTPRGGAVTRVDPTPTGSRAVATPRDVVVSVNAAPPPVNSPGPEAGQSVSRNRSDKTLRNYIE